MKIDMYTLLGMIKDGKAPKRIKQTFDDGCKEGASLEELSFDNVLGRFDF